MPEPLVQLCADNLDAVLELTSGGQRIAMTANAGDISARSSAGTPVQPLRLEQA